ncbi:MAG: outer membrane protein assembly factor BamD [Actinobacteria bacterium]|nr:outer membrane protein assembly factor BamD [Actinomycetota bacterium]MBM3709025.1 outer membrane protein assembly factor BamD [Actinomycetota bacterium]MBM3711996.1 outer membrane protein assembly factor BamD [Actinomycetota bacterium]
MYLYKSSRSIGAGAIFFIVLLNLVLIGSGYLFYTDKGRFWDFIPIISISSVVISLALLIFYFVRRSGAGYIFLLFFLIFLAGLVLSSFFGTFALYNSAVDDLENKKYTGAIENFKIIIDEYPSSKYADDSLKNLARSFYINGDYEDAILHYEEAAKKKIIDDKSLEIKKIFADCFLKIAEKKHYLKDYTGAANNYLIHVFYLEDIVSNFPDTNEAFIAKYKIPEHLFNAATDFSKAKEWVKSREIFQDIIDNYPESEYLNKSNESLFYIYTGSANELKNNKNYKQAVIEFLNVLDLQQNVIDSKAHGLNYQKEIIFRNIPPHILIQAANEEYRKNNYVKALFVYEYILREFPEKREEILANFISSKINIIKAADYEPVIVTDPTGSFKKTGTSKIIFENKTEYTLTIYIDGPDYTIIELEKGKKFEIELNSGTYKIAAELEDVERNPFYGEITYEEGTRYSQIFKLEEKKE